MWGLHAFRWIQPELRLLAALAVVVSSLAAVAPAFADGDPASDTLISQPVFLPFESKVSQTATDELTQLLASAKEQHLEVKVALIATPADLGAIPVLYKKPQRYADFLGQELVYYFKGVLLVVMPNGYGVYKDGAKLREDKQLLAELPPPGSTDGNALAVSAENVVRVLAHRRGLTLRTSAAAPSSSGNRGRVGLAAGVIALCAVALAVRLLQGRRRGGPDAA